MILSHDANLRRMEFSETTGGLFAQQHRIVMLEQNAAGAVFDHVQPAQS